MDGSSTKFRRFLPDPVKDFFEKHKNELHSLQFWSPPKNVVADRNSDASHETFCSDDSSTLQQIRKDELINVQDRDDTPFTKYSKEGGCPTETVYKRKGDIKEFLSSRFSAARPSLRQKKIDFINSKAERYPESNLQRGVAAVSDLGEREYALQGCWGSTNTPSGNTERMTEDPLNQNLGLRGIFSTDSRSCSSSVNVIPHSLYNVMIVMSSSYLSVLTHPHLTLLQCIFHPTAPPITEKTVSFPLPIRVSDASRFSTALYKPRDSTCNETDIVLSAAWHRDSLTLAVGTFNALYIFKPSRALIFSMSNFSASTVGTTFSDDNFSMLRKSTVAAQEEAGDPRFVLAFSTRITWPCYTTMWVHDDLLTKGTNYKPSGTIATGNGSAPSTSERYPNSQSYASSSSSNAAILASQFFVWRCRFSRCDNTLMRASSAAPSMMDDYQIAPLHDSPQIFQLPSRISFNLAELWMENSPLAEFLECEATPSFSWRAITGCNVQPLSPVPLFQHPPIKNSGGPRDGTSIKVSRMVPHPAGRFLGVLYVISTTCGSMEFTEPLSVTSPIVRVWSICSSSIRCGTSHVDDLRKNISECTPYSSVSGFASCFSLKTLLRRRREKARALKNHKIRSQCMPCGPTLFPLTCCNKTRRFLKGSRTVREPCAVRTCVPKEDTLLQGAELNILEQLTTLRESQLWIEGDAELPSCVPSFLKSKLSLLTLMATQGLASDEDLIAFHKATVPYTPSLLQIAEERRRFEALLNQGNDPDTSNDVCAAMQNAISMVYKDGCYLSLSLTHRAPVVDIVWRDTGPVSDTVFIPAVLCSLTVDNCLTIWVESLSNMPLKFDPVVVLRLQTSLLNNLLPPLTAMTSTICSKNGHSSSFRHTTARPASFSGAKLDGIVHENVSSEILTTSNISLCWLTVHHVPYDTSNIDNILRLCKSQALTEYVDFNIPEFQHLLERDDPENPYRETLLEKLEARATSTCVSFHEIVQHSNNKSLLLGPNGHTATASTVCGKRAPSDSSSIYPKKPHSSELLPATCGAHRVVDFLLVTDTTLGGYSTTESMKGCGIWVYGFRDLTSSVYLRGDCAVKNLLTPRHLSLPCQISAFISAECIPSLGLSNEVWANPHVPGFVGDSVTVDDGIMFPACYITVLSCSGDIWTCVVKPTILSHNFAHPSTTLQLAYNVTVKAIYALFPTTLITRRSSYTLPPVEGTRILRAGNTTVEDARVSDAPKTSSTCFRCFPKSAYWRSVEEHPYNSFTLLALNDQGHLFLGETGSVERTFFDAESHCNVWRRNSTYVFSSEGSCESLEISQDTCKAEEPKTQQYFTVPVDSVFHGSAQQHHVVDLSNTSSTFLSLHSLSCDWLNTNGPLHSTLSSSSGISNKCLSNTMNCTESSSSPTSHPGLPPFLYATWLPLLGLPSVLLCVTEPERHLLAIEVAPRCVGQTPLFSAVPFVDCANPCILALETVRLQFPLHTGCASTSLSLKKYSNATVSSVYVTPNTNDTCLILLGIRTELCNDISVTSELLTEHHVVLLRCRKALYSHSHATDKDQRDSFMALSLEVLFDKLLTMKGLCLILSQLKRETQEVSGSHFVDSLIDALEPQLSVTSSCFSTSRCSSGVLATFPPLDSPFSECLEASQHTLFVGICMFNESNLELSALACVRQSTSSYFCNPSFKDVLSTIIVIALTVNDEYLCVLTAGGLVFIYSLLDLPLAPHLSGATLSVYFESTCHLDSSSGPRTTSLNQTRSPTSRKIPVLHPSHVLELRSSVSNYLMDACLWSTQETLRCSMWCSTQQSNSYDAKATQLPLLPRSLGEPAFLCFKNTKGNGLSLLVVLYVRPDTTVEGEFAQHGTPYCIPFLFLRSRCGETDAWHESFRSTSDCLRSVIPLDMKGVNWVVSFASFSASFSELLLGWSSRGHQPFEVPELFPPTTLMLPVPLIEQTTIECAPRAVYHPHVLNAHLRSAHCSCALRVVLKRLWSHVYRWRQRCGEHHISATLDLPLDILTSFFDAHCYSVSRVSVATGQHSFAPIQQRELSQLIQYLDVNGDENLLWLDNHTILLPHLTLLETVQLHGLLRWIDMMLRTHTFQETPTMDSATCKQPSFLRLLVNVESSTRSIDSTDKSSLNDIGGARFLMGYAIFVSVEQSIQQAVHVAKTLQDNTAVVLSSQDATLDNIQQKRTDYQHLPNTAPLLSHCVLTSLEQKTDQEFEDLTLTTHDTAWAIQTENDQTLLQRACSLYTKITSNTQEANKCNTGNVNMRITWNHLQQMGAGLWLNHHDTVWRLASEEIPQNTYMSLPLADRNPDDVALWYIATNRLPVLEQLYKQKKNFKVVEFLQHDFSLERWRDAASKNAYALLKQKRYTLATSFFLLGRVYEEAFDVCCGQLNDPQLALFLLRVLLKRHAHDVSESTTLLALFQEITLKKLLPLAINANDIWLQSSIFWLNKQYSDAVICTLPSALRPFPLFSHDATDVRYDVTRSMFNSTMLLNDDSNTPTTYFEGYLTDCDKMHRTIVVPPLQYKTPCFNKKTFRDFLLSTSHVRQELLRLSQNEKTLLTSSLTDTSHCDSLIDVQEVSSAKVVYGIAKAPKTNSDDATIPLMDWMNLSELHDLYVEATRNILYPFSCLSLYNGVSMHWAHVSALYRMLYDQTFFSDKLCWSQTCESLSRIMQQPYLVVHPSPMFPFDVSWCISHGPEYYMHWLEKMFRHSEGKHPMSISEYGVEKRGLNDRHLGVYITSPELHKIQGIPSLYPNLHDGLNEYLKRSIRLSLCSPPQNVSTPQQPVLIYGWMNSLFSIISHLFQLQMTHDHITLIPNAVHTYFCEHTMLLSTCFMTIGWMRHMMTLSPLDRATQILSMVSTALVFAGTLVVILLKYDTKTPNPMLTLAFPVENPGSESPLVNYRTFDMWQHLEHLLTCFKSFTFLLGKGFEKPSQIRETLLDISGVLFSLLKQTEIFVQCKDLQPNGVNDSNETSHPHGFTSERRLRLWSLFQKIAHFALYDYLVFILRKTVDAVHDLFQNSVVQCCYRKNSNARPNASVPSTMQPSLNGTTPVPIPTPNIGQSGPSPIENEDGLVCVALGHLFTSFKAVVQYLEDLMWFEYRISHTTQLVLAVTIDFPCFISHILQGDICTSPHVVQSVKDPPVTTTDASYDTRWLTLFEQTALCSKSTVTSFYRVWCLAQCSVRIQLILTRAPIQYLPHAFTTLMYSSSEAMTSSQRIASFRELPHSITVDTTQPLHCLYHVPTLAGNTLSLCNGVPVGFAMGSCGQPSSSSTNYALVGFGKRVVQFSIPCAMIYERLGDAMDHVYNDSVSIFEPKVFLSSGAIHKQVCENNSTVEASPCPTKSVDKHKMVKEKHDGNGKDKNGGGGKDKNGGGGKDKNGGGGKDKNGGLENPCYTKVVAYERNLCQRVHDLFNTFIDFPIDDHEDGLMESGRRHTMKAHDEVSDPASPSSTQKVAPLITCEHNKPTSTVPTTQKGRALTLRHHDKKLSSPNKPSHRTKVNRLPLISLVKYRQDHASPILRRLLTSLRQALHPDKLLYHDVRINHSTSQEILLLSIELFLRGLLTSFVLPPSETCPDSFSWSHVVPFFERALMCYSGIPPLAIICNHTETSDESSNNAQRSSQTGGTHSELCSNDCTIWLQFLSVLFGKVHSYVLKHLKMVPAKSLATHNAGKKSNLHFSVSHLTAHPYLSLAAGVITMSIKDSFTHFSGDVVPIIGLWSFQSVETVGILTLPTTTLRFSTAPSLAEKDSLKSQGQEDDNLEKHRPQTVFSQLLRRSRIRQQDTRYDTPPTYQEVGAVTSLQWSLCGQYLIAGHAKGWVTVWFVLDSHTMHRALSIRASSNLQEPKYLPQTTTSFYHITCVPMAFKMHSGVCRYAMLLGEDIKTSVILITSGRGLDLSDLAYTHCNPQDAELFKQHVLTLETNVVCVWNVTIKDPTKPFPYDCSLTLRLIDKHVPRHDEATQFVLWPAKHFIIYGTRRGAVRCVSLRNVKQPYHWLIRPSSTATPPVERCKMDDTQASRPDPIHSRGIIKMFLLQSSYILITCHQDGTVREWDISPLCTLTFTLTGVIRNPSTRTVSTGYLSGEDSSEHPLVLKKVFNPTRYREGARLFTAGRKIGSMLNLTSNYLSPSLLDAQMAGRHHLLTLTDDGTLMLTRLY